MTRKFIDLSIYLENDVVSDPPAFAPKIQYFNHQNSFEQMAPFFPGLKQSDLPDGEVWAVEMVQLSTHNGTHLDAPYHFHSTMDKALGETLAQAHHYTRYGDWYGNPYGSWDVMFVAFCQHYAGIPEDVIPQCASLLQLRTELETHTLNTSPRVAVRPHRATSYSIQMPPVRKRSAL